MNSLSQQPAAAPAFARLVLITIVAGAAFAAGRTSVDSGPLLLSEGARIGHSSGVLFSQLAGGELGELADAVQRENLDDQAIAERLQTHLPVAAELAFRPILDALDDVAPHEQDFDSQRVAERLRELSLGLRRVR